MKRLGRWLFNLAAVVSLLLWVTTVAAWAVSHWRDPGIERSTEERYTTLMVHGGKLAWRDTSHGTRSGLPASYQWHLWRHWPDSMPEDFRLGIGRDHDGFHVVGIVWRAARHPVFIEGVGRGQEQERQLMIPLVYLLLLFTLPIILWGRQRRLSLPPKHCKQCGYDLRATPERCPECGAIPSPPEST